jgi:CrcB protein
VRVLTQIALVALGGAVGSLARWGVGLAADRWFAQWLGTAFPWGTFFINISGCLFLGWFTTVLNERLSGGVAPWIHPDNLRVMIAVGFTGAYTTFSTFEYEANNRIQQGGPIGYTYVIASVVLGLLAVRLGIALAHWH